MEMVGAIIVTHDSLGEALLNSIFAIMGPQEKVINVNNREYSAENLRQVTSKYIELYEECILFVDFYGSTFAAAKAAAEDLPIISGVNLPMLLSFFNKRQNLELKILAETVSADGKRGIVIR